MSGDTCHELMQFSRCVSDQAIRGVKQFEAAHARLPEGTLLALNGRQE